MSESSTSKVLPAEWVDRIFVRLHGRFGNMFFDKYRLGQISQAGEDIGIENAKLVWGEELGALNVEQITRALSTSYKFPPSCDEFKSAARGSESDDGRLSADEAWGMFPHNSDNTVLVTNEIMEAGQSAWELLKLGDKVAARMAFKDAYERIIKKARECGNKPRWQLSLGNSGECTSAATEGLRRGLLSLEYIRSVLNPDDADFIASSAGYQLALPAPTEKGKQYALDAKNLILQLANKMEGVHAATD